jgi:hypothetical protein
MKWILRWIDAAWVMVLRRDTRGVTPTPADKRITGWETPTVALMISIFLRLRGQQMGPLP